MTNKNKIISPIAIDMGAKNTGVYLNHFEQGEDPTTSGNSQGKTIVIDGSNITWSQAGRTQKRHQIRTKKRRELSKRLLKVILKEYQIYPNQKQQEYLNGLLNRRGYTYLVEGLNENLIKQDFVAEYFIKNHSNFFNKIETFYIDFLVISNDIEKAKKLKETLTLSKNEAKKEVEENDNKQEFADAYDNIKTVLNTQVKAEKEGHKYRTEYLDNIKKDIENSEVLKPLLNNLDAIKLNNLIGNISNLQLRVLRKYFNNKSMANGDIWQPEKLHMVFFKWIKSWHAKQENEKENRIEILSLKDNSNILEVFTSLSPKKTIPPYEDQNNRRPPKDTTLRLNPTILDQKLNDWEKIIPLLVQNYIYPQTNENIIEKVNILKNIKNSTQVQKNKSKNENSVGRQILANTLHRILDRSILLDPYKLRWLSKDSHTQEALKAKNLLNKHSNNNADKIIALAKEYYLEVDSARQGLWTDNEASLFFKCDTNPPHKGKLIHKLVGHILREPLNQGDIKKFRDKCWNMKIGRSAIKGLAGKIEETRKNYGNSFNYIAQTIKKNKWVSENRQVTKDQKNRWLKFEHDNKDVVEAINHADLIATKINEFLQHDKKEKYNNPYSIAQLYNHLEDEKSGFSKTDKFNTEENSWRDEEQKITVLNKSGEKIEKAVSNAVRLTADSIRPFDGLLDRIISRQAYEIASMKIKQIEELDIDKNDGLFIPIFMEQNRFKFEQDMHDIKGARNVEKKAKDKVKKGLEKQEEQWKNKNNRIKKNEYCPYTGEKITNGEVDHIIPQSSSKKHGDVVFNSEANLIYCSGTGNHNKGNNRYTFKQLNPRYLKEIFGDETNIKQNIITFVKELTENDAISFHNLEIKEQNYLRHALFINELDYITFPILNTRYKTFVNGTQGYLGKQIRKLLQEKYPNIQVKTYQISAQEVSQLRSVLGSNDSNFKKQDRQGAFSHVIDASLVFATALQEPKIAEELMTTNVSQLTEKGIWLQALLPSSVLVQHIKRKSKYRKNLASTQIFKDGLYGERFMTVLLNEEKLYYGFALDNCHEIEPLKSPKETDKNYETKLLKAKEKHQIALENYFKLLKPFLYTGRKNAKKPVTGTLAENWQYDYLTIDKTKAIEHLQKCAKEECSEQAIKQAEKLNKLRYSVEKKNIKSILLVGERSKKFITELKGKKFNLSGLILPAKADWQRLIKHPLKDYKDNTTCLEKCFGKSEMIEVDNPIFNDFWHKLAKESNLEIEFLKSNLLKTNKGELAKTMAIIPEAVFKNKLKQNEELKALQGIKLLQNSFNLEFKQLIALIPETSWEALFKDFFHTGKTKNINNHKKIRKNYSLPIVSAPSGGFRIKRHNPSNNQDVYQVSSIEGLSIKGYDETLKTPVLIDELTQSKNTAPLAGKQPLVEKVCYLDEWRNINIPKELEGKVSKIEYIINSKDRFRIRINMPMEEFSKIDNSISHFSQITAEIKEEKELGKFNKKIKILDSDLLGNPRSNLSVEYLDKENIVFSYIVATTNAKMKQAYQEGTPVND